MMNVKNKAVLCLAGVAFNLLLCACSFQPDPSKILAVEVGNPLDKKPGKPVQPNPLSLVQVDLQTGDLEEIARIDFTVQAVNLVVLAPSGKEVMVASNNLKTGSQLTLIPKRSQPLYFSVPDDVLENNSQLKIQLSFVGENPGVVRVESQEFAIAPQTEPLQLSLPDVSEYKTSNQALVISKSIDKSSLFSSSEAQASQGGVGDTPQPVSNRLAVYKLKGS